LAVTGTGSSTKRTVAKLRLCDRST